MKMKSSLTRMIQKETVMKKVDADTSSSCKGDYGILGIAQQAEILRLEVSMCRITCHVRKTGRRNRMVGYFKQAIKVEQNLVNNISFSIHQYLHLYFCQTRMKCIYQYIYLHIMYVLGLRTFFTRNIITFQS